MAHSSKAIHGTMRYMPQLDPKPCTDILDALPIRQRDRPEMEIRGQCEVTVCTALHVCTVQLGCKYCRYMWVCVNKTHSMILFSIIWHWELIATWASNWCVLDYVIYSDGEDTFFVQNQHIIMTPYVERWCQNGHKINNTIKDINIDTLNCLLTEICRLQRIFSRYHLTALLTLAFGRFCKIFIHFFIPKPNRTRFPDFEHIVANFWRETD